MITNINKQGLLTLCLLLLSSATLVVQLVSGSSAISNQNNMPIVNNVAIRKVAMVVAYRDFRDQEYFIPKKILEKSGIRVATVSNKEGIAIGIDGGEAIVSLLVSSLKATDYDAIIFIGGSGATKYLDNADSYRVAEEAISLNKILGAICVAPVILANGGFLDGKNATVWSGPMNKIAIDALKAGGAKYINKPVVVDGLIVTGNGPDASEEFTREIIKIMIKTPNNKPSK
ncbi:MAG: DJ-1/PfpI family protein [bacterium]